MTAQGQIVPATPENISVAAQRLAAGGLVSFPTETVYGLGADATSDKAVASIFAAKGRPEFNPLIVHVADRSMARKLAQFDERAEILASNFWPGPLTLVLPRTEDCPVSRLASAGLPTLAVRVPAHPVARALLKDFGGPVAAPSANRSGSISPTAPMHVQESLGAEAGIILAAGRCAVGLESTVIDLSGEKAVLLRPGAVTQEEIEDLIGAVDVAFDNPDNPKSPGQLLKHYAPGTPMRLKAVDVQPNEALLAFGSIKFMGVVGGGAAKDIPAERFRNLSETGDPAEAAANLFAMLHDLDKSGAEGIAVMSIPETGLGVAVNDRLKRAAAGSIQGD